VRQRLPRQYLMGLNAGIIALGTSITSYKALAVGAHEARKTQSCNPRRRRQRSGLYKDGRRKCRMTRKGVYHKRIDFDRLPMRRQPFSPL